LKEGIHIDKMLFGKGWYLVKRATVQVLACRGGYTVKAMIGDSHILVSINLEKVSSLHYACG
jgi:hypothetical protein